jgi:hypothetical protein
LSKVSAKVNEGLNKKNRVRMGFIITRKRKIMGRGAGRGWVWSQGEEIENKKEIFR